MISALEKNEESKGIQFLDECFNVKEGYQGTPQCSSTEQRLEGREGGSSIAIWGKSLLGTRENMCKAQGQSVSGVTKDCEGGPMLLEVCL